MKGKIFGGSSGGQKITVIFETTPETATVVLKDRNKKEITPKKSKTYSVVPRIILLRCNSRRIYKYNRPRSYTIRK